MAEYRLKIEIEVDADSFEDALEQGLDLLMGAPSIKVEVTHLETGSAVMLESSPDKASEVYGESEG